MVVNVDNKAMPIEPPRLRITLKIAAAWPCAARAAESRARDKTKAE
jgi:hypothetical protein